MMTSMVAGMPPAFSYDRSTSASFFSGATPMKVDKGDARIVCRKPDIHPPFFREAKVFCKGEHVLTTGGTQAEYVVDVWSGNHPFFLGEGSNATLTTDQVEKFRRKFGSMAAMNNIMNIPKGTALKDFKKQQKSKKDNKGKKKK